MEWADAPGLVAAVEARRGETAAAFAACAAGLVAAGCLTADDAAELAPRVSVRLVDQRKDRRERLPRLR